MAVHGIYTKQLKGFERYTQYEGTPLILGYFYCYNKLYKTLVKIIESYKMSGGNIHIGSDSNTHSLLSRENSRFQKSERSLSLKQGKPFLNYYELPRILTKNKKNEKRIRSATFFQETSCVKKGGSRNLFGLLCDKCSP